MNDADRRELERILDKAFRKFRVDITKAMQKPMVRSAVSGNLRAQRQAGIKPSINVASTSAERWYRGYAYDLTGRGGTVIGGEFTPWLNQYSEELRRQFQDTLLEGIEQGKSVYGTDSLATDIQKLLGTEYWKAERIARTEVLRANAQSALAGIREMGYTKARWITLPDDRACDECEKRNGKVYDVDRFPEIPAHPNCRCTPIPVLSSLSLERRLGRPEKEGPSAFVAFADWKAMSMDERRKRWEKLPQDVRDDLADPLNSIDKRMKELLYKDWEVSNVPTEQNILTEVVAERVWQYERELTKDSKTHILDLTVDYWKQLKAAGFSNEDAFALVSKGVDSLMAQSMEAYNRQLGDHGIRHIQGDIDRALMILKVVPGEDTERNKAMIMTAGIFHDVGYLTEPSRMFLDEGHIRWSQDWYSEKIGRELTEQIFTRRESHEIEYMIRTHDGWALEWKEDLLGSAFRMADNLGLFQSDKLPPLFRYVPDNIDVLIELADGDISLETAKRKMRTNVMSEMTIKQEVRDALYRAIDEVSEFTPKATLGMLGGDIQEVVWRDDHPVVRLKYSDDLTKLQRVQDLGQKQFAKFAEAYKVDPKDFTRSLHFSFINEFGDVALEGEIIGDFPTEIRKLKQTPLPKSISEKAPIDETKTFLKSECGIKTGSMTLVCTPIGPTPHDVPVGTPVSPKVAAVYANGVARYDAALPDSRVDSIRYDGSEKQWASMATFSTSDKKRTYSTITLGHEHHDAELLEREERSCVVTGWHPKGCDTIKAESDHEEAHRLITTVNNAGIPIENFLESVFRTTKKDKMGRQLSGYAAKNPSEMGAEAWSEFVNNPNPRPMAMDIGEEMLRSLNEYRKMKGYAPITREFFL